MPLRPSASSSRRAATLIAVATVIGGGGLVVAAGGGTAAASDPPPVVSARVGTVEVGGFVTGPRGFFVDGVLVRAFDVDAPSGADPVASAVTYEKPDGPDRGTRPDAPHGWYALQLPPGDYRLSLTSSPGTRPFVPEDYPGVVTVGTSALRLQTVALEDGVPNAAPTATVPPSISGTRAVGGTLVADPGVWSIDGTTYSYAWTVDGAPVAGDGNRLRLDRTTAGRSVAVTVTAARPGWEPGRATSPAVQIRRVGVRLEPELARSLVTTEQRAVVRITARPRTASGGPVTGPFEVVAGGRVVAVGTMRAADRGFVVVRLPELPRGRYAVRVDLLGDRTFEAATESAGTLFVSRPRR